MSGRMEDVRIGGGAFYKLSKNSVWKAMKYFTKMTLIIDSAMMSLPALFACNEISKKIHSMRGALLCGMRLRV